MTGSGSRWQVTGQRPHNFCVINPIYNSKIATNFDRMQINGVRKHPPNQLVPLIRVQARQDSRNSGKRTIAGERAEPWGSYRRENMQAVTFVPRLKLRKSTLNMRIIYIMLNIMCQRNVL